MHRSRFYDIRASRTRLHDHFFGGRHYTTIALQPSVSAATTIAQRTFHVSALGPSAVPTPSVHTERPLPCCSMVSCSAPCRNSLHLLMLFEEAHDGSIRPHCQEHNDYACFDLDLTRGLVAFTFSLLPQCQVWSVHCRLGSNCESFSTRVPSALIHHALVVRFALQSLVCSLTGSAHLSCRHCTNLSLQFIMCGSVVQDFIALLQAQLCLLL